ncbi:hypothetical protein QQF64_018504 [Cirrhinus molitorella]|uniref:Uncharacterized protein n=1 Tax=Cirrhinus molitorella TaxID=172907 RepID=A0ABR3LCW9_9TELE
MITSIKSWFCEYSTPRILVVKYWKLGLIYRLYQLTLLLYIIWYVLVRRGHQDNDIVLSSVTTKVKGIALTNTTEFGEQIWDVADYIIPPQEDGSFFLMTNMIITPNQTQSKCAEGFLLDVSIHAFECHLRILSTCLLFHWDMDKGVSAESFFEHWMLSSHDWAFVILVRPAGLAGIRPMFSI